MQGLTRQELDDDPDETATTNSSSVDWSRRGRNAFDTRVGEFLRSLTVLGRSKVLISSRIFPADLEGDTSHPVPGVISKELKGLNLTKSGELWRSLGVKGTKAALSQLFEAIQGYPLLVRAMAGQVNNFRPAPGDFDAWREANPKFNPYQLQLKQRRTHVLEFALLGIGKAVWQVLSTIAALRMPAEYKFLVAVLVGSQRVCRHEQALIRALEELETRGLVGWNRAKNTYDLHPIVRNVVWTRVTTSDRRNLYSIIQKEFEAVPSLGDANAKTIDDLFAPLELARILIEQELFGDAFEIYRLRLQEPLDRLGVIDRQKELLAPMFQGLDAPQESEISSHLYPSQAERAALHLAYVMEELGDTKAALKLMRYLNSACRSKTCRLHQIGIFDAEGQRNTGETIIRDLLQDIRKRPREYELSHEFQCLYFLACALLDRNERTLARLAFDRMRSIRQQLLKQTALELPANQTERWLLQLEYDFAWSGEDYVVAVASASKLIALARRYKNELWSYSALRARFSALLKSDRIEEAVVDLRLVTELSRTMGGISKSLGAEIAQAELLTKQGKLGDARDLLKSVEFRFGSVLSVWDRLNLLHRLGKLAAAQQSASETLIVAKAIIELVSGTGDCPRGYDQIEWAITELNERDPAAATAISFPPAVSWDIHLIDPSAGERQALRQ